jgi:transcriptional regulator with XRE-family HTH domain
MNRKENLLTKLCDRDYRHAFVSEEIEVGLPFQLKAMREQEGWTQKQLAERLGTKQPAIVRLEQPGYGRFTLSTLKQLAEIFDVGLVVKFVPFGWLLDSATDITLADIAPTKFEKDLASLKKRLKRQRKLTTETIQIADADTSAQGFLEFQTDNSPLHLVARTSITNVNVAANVVTIHDPFQEEASCQ